MRSSAQGTIEYLLIVAVAVIIAVIVVGLLSYSFESSSSSVVSSSELISNAIGSGTGISVIDSVVDSSGNSAINLKNNTGSAITITSIVSGSNVSSYNRSVPSGGGVRFFIDSVASSCACPEGSARRTCDYEINYLTADGLSKSADGSISVDCVAAANSVGNIVGLGSGTLADPWVINSCLELQDMNSHLDGNFVLGSDINCSESLSWNGGAGFFPIGNSVAPFIGSINGAGFTISDLYINLGDDTNVGLFGRTLNSSIIDVGLLSASVSGYTSVGGLVGYSGDGSRITNSFVLGAVGGETGVGALAGTSSGSILVSYAVGSVSGGSSVGGLVGSNLGSLVNSYSRGSVSGSSCSGGLVGGNSGSISNSYSASAVNALSDYGSLVGCLLGGSVSSSFGVGRLTGGGGTGLIGGKYGGSVSNLYLDVNRSGTSVCCGINGSSCTCTKKNIGNSDANAFFPLAALGGDYNVPMQHNSSSLDDWNFSVWAKVDSNYPVLQ